MESTVKIVYEVLKDQDVHPDIFDQLVGMARIIESGESYEVTDPEELAQVRYEIETGDLDPEDVIWLIDRIKLTALIFDIKKISDLVLESVPE